MVFWRQNWTPTPNFMQIQNESLYFQKHCSADWRGISPLDQANEGIYASFLWWSCKWFLYRIKLIDWLIVLKCVALHSVAMFGNRETTHCGVRATTHFCMEPAPIHTSKIYHNFFIILKRVRRVSPSPQTTVCTLVIMMKKMDGP
jgi:hypothetical protein